MCLYCNRLFGSLDKDPSEKTIAKNQQGQLNRKGNQNQRKEEEGFAKNHKKSKACKSNQLLL